MNRTAYEVACVAGMRAHDLAASVDYPFLALHGAADDVTLPEQSARLHMLAATPEDDKELLLLDGLLHETHNEAPPGRERALEAVGAYIARRFARWSEKL